MRYVPRSPWFRAALVLPSLVAVVVLLWWRGPDWNLVARAFNLVDWAWIVFAIALNLVSVLVRSPSSYCCRWSAEEQQSL